MWRTYYLSTDSAYIKYVGYSIEALIVAMFLIANLHTIFHTQCVTMFITYFCTKLHMPSMENNLFLEAKRCSASQEILSILWDLIIQYHVQKNSTLVHILSRYFMRWLCTHFTLYKKNYVKDCIFLQALLPYINLGW